MYKQFLVSLYFLFLCVLSSHSQDKEEPEKDDYCKEWADISNIEPDHQAAIKINNEYFSKASMECKVSIYRNTAIRYMLLSNKDSSYYYLDKSIALCKELDDDYLLAASYFSKAQIALTRFYDGSNDGEEALKKSRKLLIKFPDTKAWLGYYANMSILSSIKNQPVEGIKYSDSSIIVAEKIKDKMDLPNLYHNRGWQYFNLGQYDLASKDYLQALELKKKYLSHDIVSTYSVLSSCLIKLDQWEKAKKYVDIGVKLSRKENNDYILLRNYIDLSDINMHFELQEKATKANDSALYLAKKLINLEKEAIVLMQKSNIINKYNKNDSQVKNLYQEAYLVSKKTANSDSKFNTIKPLISHLITIEDFFKAKKYLNELKELTQNTNNKLSYVTTFHELSSKYYQGVKNINKALFHQLKYTTYKDSLSKCLSVLMPVAINISCY